MKSATEYSLLVKGIIERIGLSDAILTHKPVGKPVYEVVRSIPDHTSGISLILDALVDPEYGVLESISRSRRSVTAWLTAESILRTALWWTSPSSRRSKLASTWLRCIIRPI